MTGAGRGFSSGADLKAGFDPADDGMPDVRKELHELYHPIIAGVRRLEKPVVAAVNGPAVGIGASLALRLRPGAGRRVGLLRPGLREHRPDARRRLDPVRARRPWARRAPSRWRCSASAWTAQQALDWGLVNYVYPDDRLMPTRQTRSWSGSRNGPDALLRRPRSRRSTGCSTPTWTASSTSRPSSSTPSRARATSRRAWLAFVEKRAPEFQGA